MGLNLALRYRLSFLRSEDGAVSHTVERQLLSQPCWLILLQRLAL